MLLSWRTASVAIQSLQAWLCAKAAVQRAQHAPTIPRQLRVPKENVLRVCMAHLHLQFKLGAVVGLVPSFLWRKTLAVLARILKAGFSYLTKQWNLLSSEQLLFILLILIRYHLHNAQSTNGYTYFYSVQNWTYAWSRNSKNPADGRCGLSESLESELQQELPWLRSTHYFRWMDEPYVFYINRQWCCGWGIHSYEASLDEK